MLIWSWWASRSTAECGNFAEAVNKFLWNFLRGGMSHKHQTICFWCWSWSWSSSRNCYHYWTGKAARIPQDQLPWHRFAKWFNLLLFYIHRTFGQSSNSQFLHLWIPVAALLHARWHINSIFVFLFTFQLITLTTTVLWHCWSGDI